MGSNQLVRLQWNTHQTTLLSNLESYLNSENMVDCTLAAEGHYLRAHKVILCACSPYFQELLSVDTEKHPIIYLHNVKYTELQALLSYMYRGETNINQDNVPGFLRIAESLQMHGIFNSNRPSTISDEVEQRNQEEENNDEVEEEEEEGQEEEGQQQEQEPEVQEATRDLIFKNKLRQRNQILQDRLELYNSAREKNQNNHNSGSSGSRDIIINGRKRAHPNGRRSSASSSSTSSTTSTAAATNQTNNNNNNNNQTQQQEQPTEEINPQFVRTRDVIFNDFLDKFASGSNNNNSHSQPKQPRMDPKKRTSMPPLLSTSPATTTTTTFNTMGKSSLPPRGSQMYHRHANRSVIPYNNNNNNNPSSSASSNAAKSSVAASSSNTNNSIVNSSFYIPDLQHNDELTMTRNNEINPFDEENSTNPDDEEFKDEDQIQDELNSGDQSFRCNKCGKQYTSNKSLWRHRKFTCDGKQAFNCHLCGKSFSRSDNLRRHAVVAHSAQ